MKRPAGTGKLAELQTLVGVTAVILAGGLGTRLRPVVPDRPKILAEVRGRPFVTYLFHQLASAKIGDVVLCTGYLGEDVRATFGDSSRSISLTYSHEPSPLGTAGALRLALPLLKSDSVLVMNGDSFCEADLEALWTWHKAQRACGTLLLSWVPDTSPYGRVHVDADGVVLGFDEKNSEGGPGWVNSGVYLINRRLLETIPAGRAVSLEREMFTEWNGQGLYGYRGEGRFLDIGTPESYALAEQFFSSHTSSSNEKAS